jgi:hypothetical protein
MQAEPPAENRHALGQGRFDANGLAVIDGDHSRAVRLWFVVSLRCKRIGNAERWALFAARSPILPRRSSYFG